MSTRIYIGTILLEKNRWAKGKQPSYSVREWLPRFEKDGFDGLELWENHVLLAPPEEAQALERSRVPVAVYNTYMGFDDRGEEARRKAAQMAARLKAQSVKYNVGADKAKTAEYVNNVRAWAEMLPKDCRLLCECHAGTIMEKPGQAAEVFAELKDEARFQAIVHPFTESPESLRAWFRALGPKRITHAHVQYREKGTLKKLSADAARNKEILAVLREAGFAGTYTLEFTEGTSAPGGENMESLYRAALEDRDFLQRYQG